MRLLRRQGEALVFHQRWKSRAAFAVAGVLMGLVAIVAVFERFDEHFDILGEVGFRNYGPVTKPKDNIYRRLVTITLPTTTAPPEQIQVYPNDYVIRKYDENGNENWDIGTYGNAPAGNKVGIIVHIIGTLYMLVGLNTVCDIYFCGALDEMVEKWQVQPDVAGATFMAAGGSAPELFTSLIGAVITENDVGFGTIVGSAVFNVLAVIGCCGMAAQEPIGLSWWPLFRDCSFYIIGLLVLAIFAYGESIQMPDIPLADGTIEKGKRIGGGKIELWEAIVLFILYLVYCTIMVFNEKLYAWLQGKIDARKGVAPADASKVAPMPIGESEDAKTAELKDAAQAEPAPGPPEHMAGASGGTEVAAAEAAAPAAPADAAAAPTDADGKPVLTKSKTQDHSLDHHLRRVHHKAHMAHHHEHPICMRSKSEGGKSLDSAVKVATALAPVARSAQGAGAIASAGLPWRACIRS